jgi:hypothetical protein
VRWQLLKMQHGAAVRGLALACIFDHPGYGADVSKKTIDGMHFICFTDNPPLPTI